jgi:hypothetical protein
MKPNLLLILFLIHCTSYPTVMEREDSILIELERLDKIKEWIRPDCGGCHTSTLSTANPKATRVFDLKFSDWMSRMNQRQLEKTFIERLGYTVKKQDRQAVSDALGAQLHKRRRSKPI